MESKPEPKNYRKHPRFYGELMGGLLVAYSSAAEASRYIIASDILGYVNASLIFTKKIENKYLDEDISYRDLMNELSVKIQSAIAYFKAGESATSTGILSEVVGTLKVIIMCEYMVAENWELTTNPLGTSNVEHDRIINSLYKDIE